MRLSHAVWPRGPVFSNKGNSRGTEMSAFSMSLASDVSARQEGSRHRAERSHHPRLKNLAAQLRPRESVFSSKGSNREAAMSDFSRSLPSDESALHVVSPHQEDWSNPRFKKLAERLRQHSTRTSPVDEDTGVTSTVGLSATEALKKDLNVFPTKKRAAVLVCLYQGADGEFRVILTKRSGSLSSHSGEVSLPGGKRDESDADDTATALREAHEEIGLLPSQVRVVTSLEPFLSKTLLSVTPVIGLLDDVKQFKPVPNPGEVDTVFDAPLEIFLKNENYRFQELEWLGIKYRLHYFKHATNDGEKFVVFGLTASILIRTASIIYQREPDFPEFTPFVNRWYHLPEALDAMQ